MTRRTHYAIVLVALISLLAAHNLHAQVTLYYDEQGNITMKELATHYRIANVDTITKKFIGNVKDYWYNDTLRLNVTYDASGKREGPLTVMSASGAVKLTGQYKNGLPSGRWQIQEMKVTTVDFNTDRKKPNLTLDSLENQLARKEAFHTSEYIRKKDYPEIYSLIYKPRFTPDKDAVFNVVEAQAEFPGGMQVLGKFLGAFLKYPEEALKNKIKGKVIIGFTIAEDGSLTDFKVIQSLGYGCDEEAIRVLKLLPDWVPGYQSGKNVKSQFSLPITFQ